MFLSLRRAESERRVSCSLDLEVIRTLVVCGSVENARVVSRTRFDLGLLQYYTSRGQFHLPVPGLAKVMRLFSEDVMKYSRNRHASLVRL